MMEWNPQQPENVLECEYINIQNKDELTNIIQVHKKSIQYVLKQMQDLSSIFIRNKEENSSVLQKMIDIKHKNGNKINLYSAKLQNSSKLQRKALEDFAEERQKTLKALQNRKILQMGKQQQQLQSLQGEYKLTLFKYEEEEEKFLKEIRQKSMLLINKQYDHHDNMNKQQNKEVVQNDQLLKVNLQLIKKIKGNVRQQAGNIVLEEKELNQNKNYELKAKLLQLREQLSKLKKDRNNILRSRNDFKINQSLNEEEVEEYKAVGSLQKAKIKVHKDKVEGLKKLIGGQISKLQQKIKEKKRSRQNQLKGNKIKLFNIQKNKQEMKANLQRYKLLGDTILLQRQQVEQFFLMAIQVCKREVDTKEGQMESRNEKHYGEKVDIDDLLPKDKHRIVTNLYTKLALAPK